MEDKYHTTHTGVSNLSFFIFNILIYFNCENYVRDINVHAINALTQCQMISISFFILKENYILIRILKTHIYFLLVKR